MAGARGLIIARAYLCAPVNAPVFRLIDVRRSLHVSRITPVARHPALRIRRVTSQRTSSSLNS
jgi:hypothetical protein